MSRSRWFVLLGPPLLILVATRVASAGAGGGAPPTRGAPIPGPVAACQTPIPGPASAAARVPGGAWWRRIPVLDRAGFLTGWRLEFGLGSGPVTITLLPAESAASGPEEGHVVVAADDGARSEVRLIDVAARCERTIEIGAAIARQAIADRPGDGVLVHLLDRQTRADLGTWHVDPDGRRTLVADPVPAEALAAAGIERVWSTNLLTTRDGRRFGVQSCDPDGCVTRIIDRATGAVSELSGGQGDVIGFSGDQLVTMAACHGIPCGVLAWDDGGRSHILADKALGAAVAADGMVVVAIADATDAGGAAVSSIAIDPRTNLRYPPTGLAPDTVPIGVAGALAGIEIGPDAIGLTGPSGHPTTLEVRP